MYEEAPITERANIKSPNISLKYLTNRLCLPFRLPCLSWAIDLSVPSRNVYPPIWGCSCFLNVSKLLVLLLFMGEKQEKVRGLK